MNALRNKVQLIGRLGKNPDLMSFDEGKVKCTFPVATNEVFRNGDGERVERTQWHDVVTWGALAESQVNTCKKALKLPSKADWLIGLMKTLTGIRVT